MRVLEVRSVLAVVAALALGGAAQAAPDRTLSKSSASALVQDDIGQPYWILLAQCAGVFGATSNYDSDSGRKREAEADAAQGTAMLEQAIARLQIDRGLDRKDAFDTAAPQVDLGRRDGRAMLDAGGTGAQSSWNWARSSCLDIAEAYRHSGN